MFDRFKVVFDKHAQKKGTYLRFPFLLISVGPFRTKNVFRSRYINEPDSSLAGQLQRLRLTCRHKRARDHEKVILNSYSEVLDTTM